VETDAEGATLCGPAGIIATASPADIGNDDPPSAVDLATARATEPSFRGWHAHPFPGCFVCGPDRAVGDGLRLFAGPLADRPDTVACVWVPHPSLIDAERASRVIGEEFVWAALDCPGAWTSDVDNRPLVLGTMTATVGVSVEVGETYVVVGQHRRTDGRKTRSATALYDEHGRLRVRAEQVWIEVDPAIFGQL
jgi:hypothetical protein